MNYMREAMERMLLILLEMLLNMLKIRFLE